MDKNGISARHQRHSSQLVRLPLALVMSIFAFATDNSKNATTTLHTLAQVSREWNVYALDIASAAKLRKATVDKVALDRAACSRRYLLDLRYELTLRRTRLRELSVTMREPASISMELWSEVLATAPLLESLRIHPNPDRSTVHTAHCLVSIVRAAARHCPRLRVLEWPYGWDRTRKEMTTSTVETVVGELLACLPCWKPYGGLRILDLNITSAKMTFHPTLATQYVTALAHNCPRLESTHGQGHLMNRAYGPTLELWPIAMDTWERFCTSCSQLTSFDWSAVPFATAFFETFGRFPKPNLTTLVLGSPSTWYDRQHPASTEGFGATARNPQAVLRACPALRDLRIVRSPRHASDPRTAVDANLFGDAFCEALTTHCLLLERVEMCDGMAWEPIKTFTDKAMDALATLPRLANVSLDAVSIMGDGVFALIVGAGRNDWKVQREYTITVGRSDDTPYALTFYDMAMQFLSSVADWGDEGVDERGTPLPCASERVVVRLHNGIEDAIGRDDWVRDYSARLVDLVHTAMSKHPRIRLRVVLTRPCFGSDGTLTDFACIKEVDFYTESATLPQDDDWSDDSDERIDDVFVERFMEDDMSYDGMSGFDAMYDVVNNAFVLGDYYDYDDEPMDDDYDPESLYPF